MWFLHIQVQANHQPFLLLPMLDQLIGRTLACLDIYNHYNRSYTNYQMKKKRRCMGRRCNQDETRFPERRFGFRMNLESFELAMTLNSKN